MQVLPLNVLCITMLYIDIFKSPLIKCPQWISIILLFADKVYFNNTTVHSSGLQYKIPTSLGSAADFFPTSKPLESPTIALSCTIPSTTLVSVLPQPTFIPLKSTDVRTTTDPCSQQSRRSTGYQKNDGSEIF